MPSWVLKAITQRAIGALPAPHYWNELFQKHVSKSIDLDDTKFASRLDVAQAHLRHYRTHAASARSDLDILEVGTGWFPIVPIALWLCGANEIHTYDISRHVTPARLYSTLSKFIETYENGTLLRHLPDADPRRLEVLASVVGSAETIAPEETLRQLGIDYVIEDINRTTLEPASVDLIVSYAVLEYPSAAAIREMLRTFKRILRQGGVMSHWIDMGDEYAYFDRTITPYNFLRFSSSTWNWINNKLIPMNRLRLTDHRRLVREGGFHIVEEKATRGREEDLAEVPLAEEFRSYPREDLLALDAWLLSTPVPA